MFDLNCHAIAPVLIHSGTMDVPADMMPMSLPGGPRVSGRLVFRGTTIGICVPLWLLKVVFFSAIHSEPEFGWRHNSRNCSRIKNLTQRVDPYRDT